MAGTGGKSFCVKRERLKITMWIRHTHESAYTLLLGLPNEILMGDLGTVGAVVAGGLVELAGLVVKV